MHRMFLVGLALLPLASSFVRGADPVDRRATGDLIIQARDILKRYCAECHTGSRDPGKSMIDLLDHAEVVMKNRPVPLVVPGGGRSRMLELIKDGSMPPGNKPGPSAEEIAVLEKWVNAKASAYPRAFDERYTLTELLDDQVKEAANYRYVSFAHLIEDGKPPPKLRAAEQRLGDALFAASGKKVTPVPVDPAATLFRIDIRGLGWHSRGGFIKWENRKSGGVAPLQAFDLILMEYPYLSPLASGDALEKRLSERLRPMDQLRPIPFIRGDWLTDALLSGKNPTPLGREMKSLTELGEALAKLEAPTDGPQPQPFAGAKPVQFPAGSSDRRAFPPLGAWYSGDILPTPAAFDVKAELVVAGKPVAGVKVDQPFTLRVTSERRVFVTAFMVLADGEVRAQAFAGGNVLHANTPRELAPAGSFKITSIVTGAATATEHLVLFVSEKELTPPVIVQSLHNERQVWRLWFPPSAPDAANEPAVIRKVIPIQITQNE